MILLVDAFLWGTWPYGGMSDISSHEVTSPLHNPLFPPMPVVPLLSTEGSRRLIHFFSPEERYFIMLIAFQVKVRRSHTPMQAYKEVGSYEHICDRYFF